MAIRLIMVIIMYAIVKLLCSTHKTNVILYVKSILIKNLNKLKNKKDSSKT